MQSAADDFPIGFARGGWRYGETTRPGPSLIGAAKAAYVGLPPLKVAGAYSWDDPQTLRLVLRYIESPHTETLICRFDGDRISVTVTSIFAPPPSGPTLEGVLTPSARGEAQRPPSIE
jgi:hypothetical protein